MSLKYFKNEFQTKMLDHNYTSFHKGYFGDEKLSESKRVHQAHFFSDGPTVNEHNL
jgi:hypothetical protein